MATDPEKLDFSNLVEGDLFDDMPEEGYSVDADLSSLDFLSPVDLSPDASVPTPGRPPYLSRYPGIADRLVSALRYGSFFNQACAFAGVSCATVYTWIRRGARDVRAGKQTAYSVFAERVLKAQAECEVDWLRLLYQAGKEGSVTALTWMLERKHPDRWGRRDRQEISGPGGGPIEMKPVHELTDDELAIIVRRSKPPDDQPEP